MSCTHACIVGILQQLTEDWDGLGNGGKHGAVGRTGVLPGVTSEDF